MATKGGIEAVVEAAAATLSAQVNAQLTYVWSAWGDAATVPQVNPKHIYPFSREVHTDFPAIEVDWMPGRQLANMAPVYGEVDHTLAITAWLASDDIPTLRKQAARYLWAIWRVFMRGQNLDGTVPGLSGVDMGRYLDGEMGKATRGAMGGAMSKFVQPVGWEVIVHVEESAT